MLMVHFATDNPTKYITDLLEIKAKYMYITRTPFNEESNENIVGLQVSKLSSNGKGSLPIGFKDRGVLPLYGIRHARSRKFV